MARVTLNSQCASFTGGETEFDIAADTVGRLVTELERRFPGLGAFIEDHMSLAIDGEIHQDAWISPIGPDSEVYLIPRIGGG
jgi:molybdopterin synthase sulfur carrier subunit